VSAEMTEIVLANPKVVSVIPLSRNLYAIVDTEDMERLSVCGWYASWCHHNFYATSTVGQIRMHRFLLGCSKGDGKVVDHINHNSLDNRKCNLRICTHTQNMQNATKLAGCSSIYKGVRKRNWGWEACIYYNKKYIYLGTWITEEDAARAYNREAIKLFGAFANLNKVSPQL